MDSRNGDGRQASHKQTFQIIVHGRVPAGILITEETPAGQTYWPVLLGDVIGPYFDKGIALEELKRVLKLQEA